MDDEKLKKGFNVGYILAAHHPALFDKLKGALQENENPYVQGLLSGSEQYAKEKSIDRSHPSPEKDIETKKKEFKDRQRQNINKDRDQGRDR